MPHLTALDVRDCERITNLTLRAVVRYLPSLRSLNLEHCTKVSAAGLVSCSMGPPAAPNRCQLPPHLGPGQSSQLAILLQEEACKHLLAVQFECPS